MEKQQIKGKNNHEIWIHRLYLVMVGILILILGYSAFHLKLNIYKPSDEGFERVEEYENRWVYDEGLPYGGMNVVTMNLNLDRYKRTLVFAPVHQSVFVYENEKLLYSYEPAEENEYGKTTGHQMIHVPLTPGRQQIRIEFLPSYASGKDQIPIFYLGCEWSIAHSIFASELVIVFMAFVALFMGVSFIVWCLYNRSSELDTRNLFYLGEFAIVISIWKITDLEIVDFFFPNHIWLAMLTLVALYSAIAPFSLFMKTLFPVEYGKLFHLLASVSIFFVVVCSILQLANVLDYREDLTVGHTMIELVILISILCALREIVMEGFSHKYVVIIASLMLCFLGTIADMLIYYIGHATVQLGFGMMSFDIYILALGLLTLKNNSRMVEKAKSADRFQNMAYHDELTSLYSRAAYVEYVNRQDFNMKDAAIFMFDLNNLKECNDTYGHKEGDEYLCKSAKIIAEVFEKFGRCFRMGGDEFCVVATYPVMQDEVEVAIKKLRVKEENYNVTSGKQYHMQVACGYARFDSVEDYDISDTLRRADKKMYQNKQELKKRRK